MIVSFDFVIDESLQLKFCNVRAVAIVPVNLFLGFLLKFVHIAPLKAHNAVWGNKLCVRRVVRGRC